MALQPPSAEHSHRSAVMNSEEFSGALLFAQKYFRLYNLSMLPPGHVAAGSLIAYGVLKLTNCTLPPHQVNELIGWGAFFAFAPDLDMFVSFARSKSFVRKKSENHRGYYSHLPILWLLATIVFFVVVEAAHLGRFYEYLALLLWLCSWGHFALDSLDYGIRWLWPLNGKFYAIRNIESDLPITEKTAFGYWFSMVKLYTEKFWLTFYSEVLLLLLFLYIFGMRYLGR